LRVTPHEELPRGTMNHSARVTGLQGWFLSNIVEGDDCWLKDFAGWSHRCATPRFPLNRRSSSTTSPIRVRALHGVHTLIADPVGDQP
jgi:hypothetical protein